MIFSKKHQASPSIFFKLPGGSIDVLGKKNMCPPMNERLFVGLVYERSNSIRWMTNSITYDLHNSFVSISSFTALFVLYVFALLRPFCRCARKQDILELLLTAITALEAIFSYNIDSAKPTIPVDAFYSSDKPHDALDESGSFKSLH